MNPDPSTLEQSADGPNDPATTPDADADLYFDFDHHLDPCYGPNSAPNADVAVDPFATRLLRLTDKGLTHEGPGALADKLARRDRDHDDRRLCLECQHLREPDDGPWRCANWRRAGVAIRAKDNGLARDFILLLQRCDGFSAIGTRRCGAPTATSRSNESHILNL